RCAPDLLWGRLYRLVGEAKDVLVSFGGLETKRLRLIPADLFCRMQSAGERMPVEHGHANRRRPQVAVVVSEEPAMKRSRLIVLAGDDSHALRFGLRLR